MTNDKEYLEKLNNNLPEIIERVNPDFIFYQSGVDILENDKIGKLSVSIKGCAERDRLVFDLAQKNNIPVTASMGGGYADKLDDIVEAHCNTYRIAKEIFI
ncbi:MAG: hypothetical protein U9P82_03630 [Bacteroidota bacterium]|nr:hypothetical protein [Bacteroidota bacterium]